MSVLVVPDTAVLTTDLISFGGEYVWEVVVGSLILFKPLKRDIHLNFVYKLGSCSTEDTLRLNYEASRSDLLGK